MLGTQCWAVRMPESKADSGLRAAVVKTDSEMAQFPIPLWDWQLLESGLVLGCALFGRTVEETILCWVSD